MIPVIAFFVFGFPVFPLAAHDRVEALLQDMSQSSAPTLYVVGESHTHFSWKNEAQPRVLDTLRCLGGVCYLEGFPIGARYPIPLPSGHIYEGLGLEAGPLYGLAFYMNTLHMLLEAPTIIDRLWQHSQAGNPTYFQWVQRTLFHGFGLDPIFGLDKPPSSRFFIPGFFGLSTANSPYFLIYQEACRKKPEGVEGVLPWLQGDLLTWFKKHTYEHLKWHTNSKDMRKLLNRYKLSLETLFQGSYPIESNLEKEFIKTFEFQKAALNRVRDEAMCFNIVAALDKTPRSQHHLALVGAHHVPGILKCLQNHEGPILDYRIFAITMPENSSVSWSTNQYSLRLSPALGPTKQRFELPGALH